MATRGIMTPKQERQFARDMAWLIDHLVDAGAIPAPTLDEASRETCPDHGEPVRQVAPGKRGQPAVVRYECGCEQQVTLRRGP